MLTLIPVVVISLNAQDSNLQTGWRAAGIPSKTLCDAQVFPDVGYSNGHTIQYNLMTHEQVLGYKFAQKLLPERGKIGELVTMDQI